MAIKSKIFKYNIEKDLDEVIGEIISDGIEVYANQISQDDNSKRILEGLISDTINYGDESVTAEQDPNKFVKWLIYSANSPYLRATKAEKITDDEAKLSKSADSPEGNVFYPIFSKNKLVVGIISVVNGEVIIASDQQQIENTDTTGGIEGAVQELKNQGYEVGNPEPLTEDIPDPDQMMHEFPKFGGEEGLPEEMIPEEDQQDTEEQVEPVQKEMKNKYPEGEKAHQQYPLEGRQKIAEEAAPIIGKQMTDDKIKEVGNSLDLDWGKVDFNELRMGVREEMEHLDVTEGDPYDTMRIALAHLKEDPQYYTKLKETMKKAAFSGDAPNQGIDSEQEPIEKPEHQKFDKGKVYLKPGEQPPPGVSVVHGEKAGTYYWSPGTKPKESVPAGITPTPGREQMLKPAGTAWNWAAHRTLQERSQIYNKLREFGWPSSHARRMRDWQPHHLRRVMIPYDTVVGAQAEKIDKEYPTDEFIEKQAPGGFHEEKQTTPLLENQEEVVNSTARSKEGPDFNHRASRYHSRDERHEEENKEPFYFKQQGFNPEEEFFYDRIDKMAHLLSSSQSLPYGSKQLAEMAEYDLYSGMRDVVNQWFNNLNESPDIDLALADLKVDLYKWGKKEKKEVRNSLQKLYDTGLEAGIKQTGIPVEKQVKKVDYVVYKDTGIAPAIDRMREDIFKEVLSIVKGHDTPQGLPLYRTKREIDSYLRKQRYQTQRMLKTETAKVANWGMLKAWEEDEDRYKYHYFWNTVSDSRTKKISLLRKEGNPYTFDELSFLWNHQTQRIDNTFHEDSFNQRCWISRESIEDGTEFTGNRFYGQEFNFRRTLPA